MPILNTITRPPKLAQKTRVAAYARVSSGKDAMLHSLSAQVSHYSSVIQSNPDWLYAGVYADEAKTGTKDSRENFQRLLTDCRAGRIDMVITKSISRFARNTVTLLQTVRELKVLEVDVFFEEQNIHTLSSAGEVMLSILASYAQEESRSASENQKWRVKRKFEAGIPCDGTILGYRYENGAYVIQPEEAEVVRSIYADYLSGMGVAAIMKKLNAAGAPTRFGNKWSQSGVQRVLHNYTYTGNLLLQKTYRENHITKKTLLNHGELPMYHAEDTHEAIVSMETYLAVQAEAERRGRKHTHKSSNAEYPFSSLLICDHCAKHYRRKVTHTGPVWICATYNVYGKAACPSKAIPEPTLITVAAEVTSDLGEIDHIQVCDGNRLVFCFKDGRSAEKVWRDRSRSESWTPEMKAAASQKAKERRSRNG